jgi:pyruvate/2-oxoacid:ferredoxin oxidoreductase beta subunit
MNGMMKALANTGNDPDSTFVVAGIGCSGKIGTYMYSYALHGVAAILNRVDDDTLRSGIGCPSYR